MYFKLTKNQKNKLAEACKNNTNVIIQIASNKIYKEKNIFYLVFYYIFNIYNNI